MIMAWGALKWCGVYSIPGRILPGMLADRMGNFNVMFITMTCSGVATLALWLPSSGTVTTIVFAVLYGFFSGAYIALTPMLVAQISNIQQIGVRTGALFFASSIGALTGSPLAGALLTTDHGRFEYVQIFAGAMMLAAASIMLFSRAFALGSRVAKV